MPITPRLKRLYLSKETLKQMRWHKEGKCDSEYSNIMSHPTDGEAWQALDCFDLEFARDSRSVCLGLSTVGTILIISFRRFWVSNLFIMLNSMLQKVSTGVDPHYLDVWQPTHQGNAYAIEKLVSINFYSYTLFVIFILNSIFYRINIRRS
jgi:hypothetical protein